MPGDHVMHNFVRDLYRVPGLKAEFQADAEAVLQRYDLTAAQRAALLEGSFAALGQVAMHPLVQMVYSIARHPQIGEQIQARDYIAAVREEA